MSEENVTLVRSLYEAFNRGDVDTVLGAFDENIEWQEVEAMPYGGTYHGPQAVAENVFGPVSQDIDGFQVKPEELYAGDGKVVAIVAYVGTGRESGKPLDMAVAHEWTLSGGKLTRFRQFADSAEFNEVLAVGTAV